MRGSIVVVAIVLGSAAACQTNEGADSEAPTVTVADTTGGHEAHNQMRDAWVAAAERDDAAAVASFYADDAILIMPNAPVASGRAAIQEMLVPYFGAASNLKVTEHSFVQSGNTAYVTGEFSESVTTPDKKTATNSGRYMIVSQRQPDGKWLIVRHAGIPLAPTTNQ
jgi:uncharacterized protein (TIGR02246 family)